MQLLATAEGLLTLSSHREETEIIEDLISHSHQPVSGTHKRMCSQPNPRTCAWEHIWQKVTSLGTKVLVDDIQLGILRQSLGLPV